MKEGLYTSDKESSFVPLEEIKKRLSFPDKKQPEVSFEEVAGLIGKAREINDKFEVGQTEALWKPATEYPDKPIVVALVTDEHFGSVVSNPGLLQEHLDIIEQTDNMFVVFNGDNVDNFNATGKWATGMMENPLPPQIISRSYMRRLKRMDDQAKIGVMSFGNHNDFGFAGGQDWYETFLGEFNCPVFTTGGLLHVATASQTYDLALTHMYWGNSKLNPTNMCKRFMDFEYPNADIAFLGHVHQSEGLHFDKGGKDRVACIGGTYKDKDNFARKHGIGGRAGSPGWAVALWPNERKMQLFKDIKVAQGWLKGQL